MQGKDQILQLCAIKPTPKGPMVFNRYIYAEENPAYWVNRIDPRNLKGCPPEGEVLRDFWAFVQDRNYLVAYNARFEMQFLELRSELNQLSYGNHAYICVMETFSDFFSTGWKKFHIAVRRCLNIKSAKWHDAKIDAYLTLRLFSFFCFLDRPVQLEPIFPKLFRIKVVRLKEKREPVLREWEDEELPF
ncbi:3'-5' exonuclease [Thermocrinis sp.]|uniref:3'-5' exonuclease n=1 Tax=Thermocrinis sp. TaxID=2024383 RepID=UPI003C04EDD3